jgi:hypothetical protein
VARFFSPGDGDTGALFRALVPLLLVLGGALVIAHGLSGARLDVSFLLAGAAVVFILVFLRTEVGLYLVVLSMLLSPEFGLGGRLAESRSVIFRTEDFLLGIIALSWLAKTAVNKDLGLVLFTPLNRPILVYIATHAIATTVGYLTGTVRTAAGFFYVVKYVEYFFVYYMVVNHVGDRAQVRRLVLVAVLTAIVVSFIGIAQIPSGERVSTPFEGDEGEPNTFGGYMLLMMGILLGVALETKSLRMCAGSLALVALFLVPFAFTLSRASYLGLVPMVLTLALVSSKRQFTIGLLLVALVISPFLIYAAPEPVVKRVKYTFQPEKGQRTVTVGHVGLDPSTSARIISMQRAWEGWQQRPILGYGVTGFGFMDAQYARTLVETGVVGLAALLWLLAMVLRMARRAYRGLKDPEERGLALGFLAGTVGLMVHAIGSNTFIIVRIMEPFWLFAGLLVILPMLPAVEERAAPRLMTRTLRPV